MKALDLSTYHITYFSSILITSYFIATNWTLKNVSVVVHPKIFSLMAIFDYYIIYLLGIFNVFLNYIVTIL